MDKKKMEFVAPKDIELLYNGNKIMIGSCLDASEKVFLLNSYLFEYFKTEEEAITGYGFIDAEYQLKNLIFQIKTNVDVEGLDERWYEDLEFWNLFNQEVVWYSPLLDTIKIAVEIEKKEREMKQSAEGMIATLVRNLSSFVEDMSKSSPEQIEKLQKTGIELLEKLEKTSVLGER